MKNLAWFLFFLLFHCPRTPDRDPDLDSTPQSRGTPFNSVIFILLLLAILKQLAFCSPLVQDAVSSKGYCIEVDDFMKFRWKTSMTATKSLTCSAVGLTSHSSFHEPWSND